MIDYPTAAASRRCKQHAGEGVTRSSGTSTSADPNPGGRYSTAVAWIRLHRVEDVTVRRGGVGVMLKENSWARRGRLVEDA